jgi:hypothetical protein
MKKKSLQDVKLAKLDVKIFPFPQPTTCHKLVVVMGHEGVEVGKYLGLPLRPT